MRILITGADSTLSKKFLATLRLNYTGNTEILMPDKDFLDITKKESVQSFFDIFKPDIVCHFEEFSDIKMADEQLDECYEINIYGTQNVVAACRKHKSRLVYLSTAHVFAGDKKQPYTTKDTPEPVDTYGMSKLMAEESVERYKNSCIIRTTSVYSEGNDNFIKQYIEKAQNGEVIYALDDFYTSPTSENELVEWLITTLQTYRTGTFHVANKGCVSEYDFVCRVLEMYGLDPSKYVERISKKDIKSNVCVPANTALDTECLNLNFMPTLPSWDVSVGNYISSLKKHKKKTKKDLV